MALFRVPGTTLRGVAPSSEGLFDSGKKGVAISEDSRGPETGLKRGNGVGFLL